MNTKKIWLLAILFGLVMSVSFFILTSNNGNTKTVNESTASKDQVEEAAEMEEPDTDKLKISTGKRAISIAVDEVQSVSGFVRPGSFVDVVIVQEAPEQESLTSTVFLENVRVLAVGKTVIDEQESENQDSYHMVTLEVSPTDGVNLALEKERSAVTLMLRGVTEETSPNVDIPEKE